MGRFTRSRPYALAPRAGPGGAPTGDLVELSASRDVDIRECETVCLALGPYRNLTTLTAAVLFLHPDCQVLNHAGRRIFRNPEVDFLSEYSKKKLDRFIQFAIKLSGGGGRGDFGGSIIHSHAFDSQHEMKALFQRTGQDLVKERVKCLFWKEPLAISNLLRSKHVDLDSVFEKEDRLRFLMPIRNPLDCAVSNIKTGHVKRFSGLGDDSTTEQVLDAVLSEILWFEQQKTKHPDRFFHYFEHSITRDVLCNLAKFLKLDVDQNWLSNAQAAMKIRSSYSHGVDLYDYYRQSVTTKFKGFPDLAEALLAFGRETDVPTR